MLASKIGSMQNAKFWVVLCKWSLLNWTTISHSFLHQNAKCINENWIWESGHRKIIFEEYILIRLCTSTKLCKKICGCFFPVFESIVIEFVWRAQCCQYLFFLIFDLYWYHFGSIWFIFPISGPFFDIKCLFPLSLLVQI